MKTFWTALLVGTVTALGVPASAQEVGPGPGTVEATLIPGGGIFFVNGDVEQSFSNYNLGGSITYNMNEYVGLEGEVGAMIGLHQSLAASSGETPVMLKTNSPDMLTYMANLVFSDRRFGHRTIPYGTLGVGGLTMYKSADLGIGAAETFLTGNIGAGVKWYATDRIGFRGDYRFMIVRANSDSPAFFGQEDRYSHRVYGAVIVNVVR